MDSKQTNQCGVFRQCSKDLYHCGLDSWCCILVRRTIGFFPLCPMWCGRCELCCYRLSAITIKVQPLRMANRCRFALRPVWTLLKISWWWSASTVMLSDNSQCRKCTSYSFRSFHRFTKSHGLSKKDTPCGLFPQNKASVVIPRNAYLIFFVHAVR